jgi:hypothetical protein
MWCHRRIENIGWIEHVRNEEVLDRVKEERNIIHTIKRRKANWIGHTLCRNCLLLLLLLAFTTHLRVLASSFLRFRDHTQGHTTVGKTPLDE